MHPAPQHATAHIALGANLDDRERAIRTALEKVARLPSTQITATSPLFETAPVGGPPDQPDYLNAAATIQTTLSPPELLGALLTIERDLGRDRSTGAPNAPRTIDIDLLLYADLNVELPNLTIPHPRMHERRFVLEPLALIAPAARHPVLEKTVAQLYADLLAEAAGPT